MTLQAWFRQEKFTTICFDNELYANTGGQESGLMQKGFVAKMAPVGKLFDKVRLPENRSRIRLSLRDLLHRQ